MKHTYKITGMSCDGYQTKVKQVLNKVKGISAVVTLEPPEATVTILNSLRLRSAKLD